MLVLWLFLLRLLLLNLSTGEGLKRPSLGGSEDWSPAGWMEMAPGSSRLPVWSQVAWPSARGILCCIYLPSWNSLKDSVLPLNFPASVPTVLCFKTLNSVQPTPSLLPQGWIVKRSSYTLGDNCSSSSRRPVHLRPVSGKAGLSCAAQGAGGKDSWLVKHVAG